MIASLGGSTMLPQTVVLNPRGEVAYNRVGSVTYEALGGACGSGQKRITRETGRVPGTSRQKNAPPF